MRVVKLLIIVHLLNSCQTRNLCTSKYLTFFFRPGTSNLWYKTERVDVDQALKLGLHLKSYTLSMFKYIGVSDIYLPSLPTDLHLRKVSTYWGVEWFLSDEHPHSSNVLLDNVVVFQKYLDIFKRRNKKTTEVVSKRMVDKLNIIISKSTPQELKDKELLWQSKDKEMQRERKKTKKRERKKEKKRERKKEMQWERKKEMLRERKKEKRREKEMQQERKKEMNPSGRRVLAGGILSNLQHIDGPLAISL